MSDEEIDRFCLIAPTKRFLITQFSQEFELRSGRGRSSDIHHEETGNHKLFHHKAVKSYCTSLLEFIDLQDILNTDNCYRIMSNTVLSNDSDLLDIEAIGESMYNTFIEERICTGPKNVWDVMHKRKLVTFNSLKKTVKVKVKDKIINLKEERGLMTRLLVISKCRPEIDISELFAKHEFTVVPRSHFDNEGKMWPCDDKSAFMNCIEGIVDIASELQQCVNRNCIVIDGMGFVHQLAMKNLVTLADL